MLIRAVVDLGLSPEEFWKLSWYEYGLYVLRLHAKVRLQTANLEDGWKKVRIIWAEIRNRLKGKGGKTWKPEDLLRLPGDELIEKIIIEKHQDEKLAPEIVEQRFPKELKTKKNVRK